MPFAQWSDDLARPMLSILVLLGVYLSYLVLSPFLVALTWAAIFAILFHRPQAALSAMMGPSRAAILTTLIVGITIVAPALLLLTALAREAPQVSEFLKQSSQTAPRQIAQIWGAIRTNSPVAVPADPTAFLTSAAQRGLAFLAPRAGAFLADVFAILGTLVAMLIALFFILRDGDGMVRHCAICCPSRERARSSDERYARPGRRECRSRAHRRGRAGMHRGIAFWFVGSRAIFWGVVIAFASLMPVVGAALVWAPAGIWLLLSGAIGRGALLLLVGLASAWPTTCSGRCCSAGGRQ
jgi:predicted PurR-regulated permease PerM